MESEPVELLEARLEHWVDSEQTALGALEYARNQLTETQKRIKIARETGAFVMSADTHGIEDIGYGSTQNRGDQVQL